MKMTRTTNLTYAQSIRTVLMRKRAQTLRNIIWMFEILSPTPEINEVNGRQSQKAIRACLSVSSNTEMSLYHRSASQRKDKLVTPPCRRPGQMDQGPAMAKIGRPSR